MAGERINHVPPISNQEKCVCQTLWTKNAEMELQLFNSKNTGENPLLKMVGKWFSGANHRATTAGIGIGSSLQESYIDHGTHHDRVWLLSSLIFMATATENRVKSVKLQRGCNLLRGKLLLGFVAWWCLMPRVGQMINRKMASCGVTSMTWPDPCCFPWDVHLKLWKNRNWTALENSQLVKHWALQVTGLHVSQFAVFHGVDKDSQKVKVTFLGNHRA